MGVWHISKYPGFIIKNNKVYYQESVKSKIKNSTKEELITQIYKLDTIPYQTIVFEGTKFYMNKFLQGAVFKSTVSSVKLVSLSQIWLPVLNYLLFTTFSSSMKKLRLKRKEDQNYKKNHKGEILFTFEDIFKRMNSKGSFGLQLEELLSKVKRDVLKENFLNLFDFSGISKSESETLITNFLVTENLDEIISSYQKLLSELKESEVYTYPSFRFGEDTNRFKT